MTFFKAILGLQLLNSLRHWFSGRGKFYNCSSLESETPCRRWGWSHNYLRPWDLSDTRKRMLEVTGNSREEKWFSLLFCTVCIHMCMPVLICMGTKACAHVYTCMCKPELVLGTSTLFIEPGSLLEPGSHQFWLLWISSLPWGAASASQALEF